VSLIDLPAELSGLPIVKVPAGHALFREGSPALLAFLVKGAVRIERGPVVLELVRAPAFVVDVGVRDARPSSSTAITLRASQAILTGTIDSPLVERALQESLRTHARAIDSLSRGTSEERLVGVLTDLAGRYGAPVGAGRFIGIPVRRRDLARMVGITIETASRILARLERDGSIRTRRDGIWIASSVLIRKT